MNNKNTIEELKREIDSLKVENAELKKKVLELEKLQQHPASGGILTPGYNEMRAILDDYLRMYATRDQELTTYFSNNFSGFTGGGDFLVKDKDEWISITRQDFDQVKDSLKLEVKDYALQKLSDTIFVATSFFKIHLPIQDHILSRETARLVLIYQKENTGWKIVHSGISIPYPLVREGEVYPMSELVSRNRFLEELVSERTIQLSETNRKLHLTNENLASEIAEHKKAQDDLVQSKQKLEAIISSTPDGIGLMSLKGDIQFMSDKVAEMYGYSHKERDEITGQSIFGYIDKTSHKQLIKNLNSLISGAGLNRMTEYLAIKKDNSRFYIEVNSTLLFDTAGNPVSILFVERDITERKKADLIIQEQNKKLHELNLTKDKLFSIIAHDLRSPFQGFIGITQIMLDEIDNLKPDEMIKLITSINKSAVSLHKLLLDLLDWARLQEGTISFHPVETSFRKVLEYDNDLTVKTANHKGIKVIFEISDDHTVIADEAMFKSVLQNLISNAVKFTKRDGVIILRSKETEDKTIEFSITDTGIGMPETLCQKLFKMNEKFGTTGTDGEPSTGFGLILCKEFVEKNNGKIWVESKENMGSSFYFTLPSSKYLPQI